MCQDSPRPSLVLAGQLNWLLLLWLVHAESRGMSHTSQSLLCPLSVPLTCCLLCHTLHYTTLHCLASLIILTSIPHLLFLLWLFILHSTDLRVHGTTLYYNSLFHNTALSSNVSVVFPSSSSVPAYYLVLLLSTALPYPGSLGGKEVEGSIGLAHA